MKCIIHELFKCGALGLLEILTKICKSCYQIIHLSKYYTYQYDYQYSLNIRTIMANWGA